MDCFFVVLKCRVCEIFRTFRFSRFLHVSFFKSSTFRFAGFIFIKKVILYSSTIVSFIFWCWFGAFFSFVLLFFFKVRLIKEIKQVKLHHLLTYVFLVLSIGTMQYTTNYVFSHMNVGYALALFQLSTIISIVLGYRIFKEQNIKKKLLGAVIMIAGSVVIILLN